MFDEAIDEVLDEVVVDDDRIDEIVVVIVSAVGVAEILVRFEAGGSAPGLLSLSVGLFGSLAGVLNESDEDDISFLAVPCCALSSSLLDAALLVSDIFLFTFRFFANEKLFSLMKNYLCSCKFSLRFGWVFVSNVCIKRR